ncbi:XRE family transcriptional regulator [Oscillibacter sp.]|uniref:helix-turn-helix domain-containing protein n=1 Tax=Oscillibacter sp. TaxID=1945593 RepID=UPI002610189D|nr:XRE family transcriptional regulator [Oscillibacter sp.]MDD3346169.1 XRE family transcriptional regulator [Oscillibacter sp.]
MDINYTVAKNIKAAREQKHLTLDAAARLTGVSRSMLAQIEKGDANPTISVLWKIANGYRVSFSSLVDKKEGGSIVIHSEQTPTMVEGEGKFLSYLIFPFQEGRMFEGYRIEILEGGIFQAQPHMAGTEEYITVFSGAVEIRAADERFELGEGDSVKFNADVPHCYSNIGTETAKLSLLIYYTA